MREARFANTSFRTRSYRVADEEPHGENEAARKVGNEQRDLRRGVVVKRKAQHVVEWNRAQAKQKHEQKHGDRCVERLQKHRRSVSVSNVRTTSKTLVRTVFVSNKKKEAKQPFQDRKWQTYRWKARASRGD